MATPVGGASASSRSAGLTTQEIKEQLKSIGLPSAGTREKLIERFDEFFGGTTIDVAPTPPPEVKVEVPPTPPPKVKVAPTNPPEEERKPKKIKSEDPVKAAEEEAKREAKKEKKEAKKEKKQKKEAKANTPTRKRKQAGADFDAMDVLEAEKLERAVAGQPASPEGQSSAAAPPKRGGRIPKTPKEEAPSPAKQRIPQTPVGQDEANFWDEAIPDKAEEPWPEEDGFWDDDTPATPGVAAQMASVPATGRGDLFKSVYKTTLCQHFMEGNCHKGDNCVMAHGEEELKQEEPARGGWTPPVAAKEVCVMFQRGACTYGDNCFKSHDPADVANAEPIKRIRRMWCPGAPAPDGDGTCKRGPACFKMHAEEDRNKEQWQIPQGQKSQWCKGSDPPNGDGTCFRGEGCQYCHSLEDFGKTSENQRSADGGGPKRCCRIFEARGFCRKGADCTFAHGAWTLPGAKVENNDVTGGDRGPNYEAHPMVTYLMGENVEPNVKRACIKQLVTNCMEATQENPGVKASAVDLPKLAELKQKFDEALEEPLVKFAHHLRPALFRRVHVGTMDYMDESHEAYRKTFDFLETTNTWHDVDAPERIVHDNLKSIGCAYQPPSAYDNLAKRAKDGFQIVIKISCLATHIKKLQDPEQWWPRLYWDKYSKLRSATVAFLWQLPPNFKNEKRSWDKLVKLTEYLQTPEAMVPGARHIIDFRHESWYCDATYEFLKSKRWCLAWLHLNNEDMWASMIPTGWTDRVMTADFVYMRLFGPDGRTHGSYDKAFLHRLFDSCPMGTTSYVNFGNRELLGDDSPEPRPAFQNAIDFRTIFSKMDLVSRIRDVRYKGVCPRFLDKEEQLLLNSFYLRFALKARSNGVSIVTPVLSAQASKYYPKCADPNKRCFEWLMDAGRNRLLHLSLHDIKEESDLWRFLRQISGCEDLQAVKKIIADTASMADQISFTNEQTIAEAAQQAVAALEDAAKLLINGTFIRWSEKARQAGLLATTELKSIEPEDESGQSAFCNVKWTLKKRTTTTTETGTEEAGTEKEEELTLSTKDLNEKEDIMVFFKMLARMSDQAVSPAAEAKVDPWKTGTWKRALGEMFKRIWVPKPRPKAKPKDPVKKEDGEKQEGDWDSLWNDNSGDNQKWEDEPPAKKAKKETVWARAPGDGEFYKASLEYTEHFEQNPVKRYSVEWANGSKGNNVIFGQDLFKFTDFPEGPDGRPLCGTCKSTGVDPDGMVCTVCDHGAAFYEKMLQQEQPEPEAWDAWIRAPMETQSGGFMYKNSVTGECTLELPPILQSSWETRVMGGRKVYVSLESGVVQAEPPQILYSGEGDEERLKASLDKVRARIDFLAQRNERVPLTADEDDEVDQLTELLEQSITSRG